MVIKNLKGQYRNSYLGFAWQFLNPVITVFLFYTVFTSLNVFDVEHYGIFLCVGLFPFNFFNNSITAGGSCIVNNSNMVKKMYFPREILVFSYVISQFVMFLIAYLVVMGVILLSGHLVSLQALAYLPVMIIVSFIFDLGIVLFLSSVTVYFRDLNHIINAFSRILFWVTPTFFMVSSLSGILSKLIWINPLTYYVVSFQEILYYGMCPSFEILGVCGVIAIFIFVLGLCVFNKLERGFAERL